MSEEGLKRIENQIGQLIQVVTNVQHDITIMKQDVTAIRQDLTATKQNVTALQENLTGLRNRVDSVEDRIVVAIRSGYTSLQDYLDDLNFEMFQSQRKARLLDRRVRRLERKNRDDDD
jgi:predicted  nucleic acid-binding Zn-ribbon protein